MDEVLILIIFPNLRPPVVEKVEKSERRFFVGLVDNLTLYTNSEKDLFRLIHVADRWRCKCAIRTSA